MLSFKSRCNDIIRDHTSGSTAVLNHITLSLHEVLQIPGQDLREIAIELKKLFYKLPGFAVVFHFVNSFLNQYTKSSSNSVMLQFIENYRQTWAPAPEKMAALLLSATNMKHKNILVHSNSSAIHALAQKMAETNLHAHFIQTRSWPGGEGLEQARVLGQWGFETELIDDEEVHLISKNADMALLGADLISADSLVNKTGTKNIIRCCSERSHPVYILTDSRKIIPLSQLPEILSSHLRNTKTVSVNNGRDHWFEEVTLNQSMTICTEQEIIKPAELHNKETPLKVSELWLNEIE